MKIKDSMWFNEAGSPGLDSSATIGVVIVEDETVQSEKAYIGTGFGLDKKQDEEKIVKYGAKFPLHIAKQLIEGS